MIRDKKNNHNHDRGSYTVYKLLWSTFENFYCYILYHKLSKTLLYLVETWIPQFNCFKIL